MILLPHLWPGRGIELCQILAENGMVALERNTTEGDREGLFRDTGGDRIDADHLEDLTRSICEVNGKISMVHEKGTPKWRSALDRELAQLFVTGDPWVRLDDAELMDTRFWEWMSLVGEPATALLRFPEANVRRFSSHSRNVYFRCWQRGRVLEAGPGAGSPSLLGLNEDQFVAIFERPGLSASWKLARAAAGVAISWTGRSKCEDVTRSALKILTGWNIIRCLELLEADELKATCEQAFEMASSFHSGGGIARSPGTHEPDSSVSVPVSSSAGESTSGVPADPSGTDLEVRSYEEHFGKAGPDPRGAPVPAVEQGLRMIIEKEGPVLVERVFRRYTMGCNIGRIGGEIRKDLLSALTSGLKKGTMAIDDELGEEGFERHVVRIPGTPAVRLRRGGSRDFTQIPASELQALARTHIPKGDARYASEEHMRWIQGQLGLGKLSGKRKTRLEESLHADLPAVDRLFPS